MRIVSALIALLICISIAAGQAVTPAVNAPLLSMAGGTAPSVIFVPTATQTIASASDVSCFSSTGSGPGQTISANSAYIGNTYRLQCRGTYSTPALNTATVTGKVKWGATTVATVTTPAFPASAIDFPFYVDIYCTIRTIGATGTMLCSGGISYVAALTGLSFLFSSLNNTAAATINTTVSSKIDLTAAWSTVIGGQTASAVTGAIEILF